MSQMVAYPPTCAPGSPEQIEEEGRVLGVAMTRAKLHLHLIEPPPGIAAESPRFDCGNLLWLENELSPFRVKDHYAGRFLAVVNEDIRFAVNLDARSANGFDCNRPTVLLAAKTYGKGVLNPLFSSVFAHVTAENPIFSKTCRRCMA